jgi:hypothetical protein
MLIELRSAGTLADTKLRISISSKFRFGDPYGHTIEILC